MPEVLDLRELGGDDDRRRRPRAARPAAVDDVDVDLDHELDPTRGTGVTTPAHQLGPSVWRRRVGVGVVVALALGVAYMLTAGRPSAPANRPPEAGTIEPPAERAARAALDAWARFASTGDTAALSDTFDPAGPQLARLRAEAASMAARRLDPPYTFTPRMLSVATGRNQDEQLVSADVFLSRPGETDQRFAWELVMRRVGPERPWMVWTVRDRSPSTSPATGGAP